MISKLRFILRIARERGLKFFLVYFLESVWFDLRYGTSTSTRVTKDKQNTSRKDNEWENGLLYVASFTSVVTNSLNIAKQLLGKDRFCSSQFLDLGCGKGKTLLVYENYMKGKPQKYKAVGIEYDPKLVEVAASNIDTFGATKACVVHDSAVNLSSHTDTENLIVYLYNSFQGDTLKSVLEQLAPYSHTLIYVDPAEKQTLVNHGYSIEHEVQGSYNADTWLVASNQ